MPIKATRSGIVTAIDTFALGDLVVDIGGGRRAKEDDIDPRVGMMVHVRIGDQVDAGREIAALHLAKTDDAAVERAAGCFEIGERADARELVLERVQG
jgi:thymidine phosphorylase